MNDDLKITDEALRQATSRRLLAGDEVEQEAALLRDEFLAMGKSLEAAAGRGDEAALVAEVQRWSRNAAASGPPVVVRSRGTDFKWQVVLGGALALSAIAAVVEVVRTWRDEGAAVSSGAVEVAESFVAPKVSEAAGSLAREDARGIAPGEAANGIDSAVAWRDSLDVEIASAEAGMQRMAGREGGLDGSLSEMNERLRALSAEFWGGQL